MNQDQFNQFIIRQNTEADKIAQVLKFCTEHEDFLLSVGCTISTYYGICFEAPEREDALAIIKYFAGKWDKSYDEDKVSYIRQPVEPTDMLLRISSAPPPASCRIIEEEVEEPGHYVPSRMVKRRKLVCKETPASMQEQPPQEAAPEPVSIRPEESNVF